MKTNNFTYTDVVLASCEREMAVSRVARKSAVTSSFLSMTLERLSSIFEAAEDNRMTDEEVKRHFRG